MNDIVFGVAMMSVGVFIGMILIGLLRPKFVCLCCGEYGEPYACKECASWIVDQVEGEV